MRARAAVKVGPLEAAALAKRVHPVGAEAQPRPVTARPAATAQAAADAASADTALAASRVARAVTDAAAHVAVMVAVFDLSLGRESAAEAEVLQHLAEETAHHVDQRDLVAARRASSGQGIRP
jgi:hypothetical protein